jgi:hypothetical protein
MRSSITNAEAVAITLGLPAIREFHFPVDVTAVKMRCVKHEHCKKQLPHFRGYS